MIGKKVTVSFEILVKDYSVQDDDDRTFIGGDVLLGGIGKNGKLRTAYVVGIPVKFIREIDGAKVNQ